MDREETRETRSSYRLKLYIPAGDEMVMGYGVVVKGEQLWARQLPRWMTAAKNHNTRC